jgi:hypothetical protein
MTEASNFVPRTSLAGSTVFARIKAEFSQLRRWRMYVDCVRDQGWTVRFETEFGGMAWRNQFVLGADLLDAKYASQLIRCAFAQMVMELMHATDEQALRTWFGREVR